MDIFVVLLQAYSVEKYKKITWVQKVLGYEMTGYPIDTYTHPLCREEVRVGGSGNWEYTRAWEA